MSPFLEIGLEIREEVVCVNRLVGKILDVSSQERFKYIWPAHSLLQVPEEGWTFLVWDPGERLVRVDPSEVRDQGSEWIVGSEALLDVLLQVGPMELVVEVSDELSTESSEYLPVEEHVETLVDPEVLHVLVGHEVPGPRVSDLVGNHEGVWLVTRE